MSLEEENSFEISEEENEEQEENKENNENHECKYKNITPENISQLKGYSVDHFDDTENKWKTYLYEGMKGELRKRLNEIITKSELSDFFEGLKYEYGIGVEKNLNKALSIYIKSAGPNSKNYLSMGRLYDIYRDEKNKFKIKADKNLEMVYLFKCFTFYPISYNIHNSNIRFPLNIENSLLSFLEANLWEVEDIFKNILLYIDELMKIEKYRSIISQRDSILIKGTIEGFLWSYDMGEKTSCDTLIALSLDNNNEATFNLAGIYLNKLKINKEKENKKQKLKYDKKKEELIIKTFDLFQILEENKYYPAYAEYGFFLYEEMNIFDKALTILKEGYDHDQINCALYYFHSFTKSEDQKIYNKNEFKADKFIEIFKPLIDAFIIGESNALQNIYDFYYIIGKKYKLFNEISNRYMKYLDEIAELCLSFTNKEKGEFYRKIYSPLNKETVELGSYHSLLFIYLYGLTIKVKKDLFKAENCIKELIRLNEHSEPFYTRLLYKIKHQLFKLGAISDFNEVENLKNKIFNLYEKNKYYEYYGNSYYYYFGELYEKGFGTAKDEGMAYFYYMEGTKPLHNLFDSFIIVHKRYLSIKK